MNVHVPLKLYNTLSKSVDVFTPKEPGKVALYTCGPTVYSYVHIGNMRAYLFADTLRRSLELFGYDVHHVMNITDVGHLTDDGSEGEDKLEVGAARENLSVWDIASKYSDFFFEECERLNIKKPKVVCKATDHIKQQIELIQKLEAGGYTYQTSDGVYFNTSQFPRYKDFARLNFKGMEAGKRVALGEKKNLADFALWKVSPKDKKRAMEWQSPWGVGFPGWHIECSAMAMHFLGDRLDIHTGGVDHIPVHHTNEIAQSECATGHGPFARFWMHCEFLILDGGSQKMSKSLGNIVTVCELEEKGYEPLAFRYLCMNSHYRKQMQFTLQAMAGAAAAYRRLRLVCNSYVCADATAKDSQSQDSRPQELRPQELRPQEPVSKKYVDYLEAFHRAVGNDLNTSQVLANLWLLLEDKALSSFEKKQLILKHESVLGLGCDTVFEEKAVDVSSEAASLLVERNRCRSAKDWTGADRIRDELRELGFEIADTPQGATLKKIVGT